MPLLRTEIDLIDIVQEMHRRGYGDHRDARYALAFNKKDPLARWKMTGEAKRIPCGGGVSKSQLKRIQTHCENVREAADHVEAIISGREMLPMESIGEHAPAIDTAVMEKMVENRTDSQIGRHLNPIIDVLGKLTDRLEKIEQKLDSSQAPAVAKKRGRKKGYKKTIEKQDEPQIDFGPRVQTDVAP
jgi:hypothetical protein